MSRDGITGLVCLAASLGLLAATRGLPDASLLVPVGPGFYPRIVLGITAALSLLLVIGDVLARRRAQRAATGPQAPSNHRLVLLTFAVFGMYVALLPYAGFRIATFIFVGLLQVTLQPPSGRASWVMAAGVALVTTLVAYYLFEYYLLVLLPRGSWTDF